MQQHLTRSDLDLFSLNSVESSGRDISRIEHVRGWERHRKVNIYEKECKDLRDDEDENIFKLKIKIKIKVNEGILGGT